MQRAACGYILWIPLRHHCWQKHEERMVCVVDRVFLLFAHTLWVGALGDSALVLFDCCEHEMTAYIAVFVFSSKAAAVGRSKEINTCSQRKKESIPMLHMYHYWEALDFTIMFTLFGGWISLQRGWNATCTTRAPCKLPPSSFNWLEKMGLWGLNFFC